MAVRESRYHLDVGEVSGASFLPAWRAPVSSLCSHSYPWPWLCGLGQMSSASFDLLLCEVTSSPPQGLVPGPRSAFTSARASATGRLRKKAAVGRGGWERGWGGAWTFFPNVRPQPQDPVFTQSLWTREGRQGCWDTRERRWYYGSLLLSCIISWSQGQWPKYHQVLGLEGSTVGISSAGPQPGPWIQCPSPPIHVQSG